ncbi:MAG: hypothetical protein J1F65_03480 [Clostridiales bacterium]|nr:hypothetical protein [Clostridiales bacterium]
MKKLKYVALILVLIAGVTLFGAWSPIQAEETEIRYADAPIVSSIASETIYYTSKEMTLVQTAGGAPTYTATANLTNSCGAVAGSEIVAFYDKYYPELIPGWDSYYTSNGKYRIQEGTYVPAVMKELYTLMQTNVNGSGTSEAEFKSGLQTYFSNRNYSLSYQNVKSGSSMNFDACKAAVDANKVMVLFITPGNVYNISEESDHDVFDIYTITGNHIMIAFGYLEMKYYNASGLFLTERFVKVATGHPMTTTGYYRINSSNLEAAYIVNVG